jgi:hypothetical protein
MLAAASFAGWRASAASRTIPPPPGAIVLFDGTNLDQWTLDADPHWKVVNGDLVVDPRTPHPKCRLATKQSFGDVTLHVEFWLPLMADKKGQARANSGVFLEGRYEVQILDSYGEPPTINGAGSIYEVAPPRVNACLPPEQWQSFDISYKSARFRGGEVVEKPRITVVYNGVKVQDNYQLQATATPNNVFSDFARAGPIVLQNHQCPVRFRNVWLLPYAR